MFADSGRDESADSLLKTWKDILIGTKHVKPRTHCALQRLLSSGGTMLAMLEDPEESEGEGHTLPSGGLD